jgi:hypothetical protein
MRRRRRRNEKKGLFVRQWCPTITKADSLGRACRLW